MWMVALGLLFVLMVASSKGRMDGFGWVLLIIGIVLAIAALSGGSSG